MAVVTGRSVLGQELCNVFGIEQGRRFVLDIAKDSIAYVTIEFAPTDLQVKEIIPILKRYRLEEIEIK